MRVFYLRDKNNFPVACVASSIYTRYFADGHKPERRVAFAVFTHNPIDRYDKKEAKRYAMGRLMQDEPGTRYSFVIQPKMVKETIVRILAQDDRVPKRTQEAARLWIKKLEERTITPLSFLTNLYKSFDPSWAYGG